MTEQRKNQLDENSTTLSRVEVWTRVVTSPLGVMIDPLCSEVRTHGGQDWFSGPTARSQKETTKDDLP